MAFPNKTAALLLAGGALLAISACAGSGMVPSNSAVAGGSATQVSDADASAASPADNTSVLKQLKKDVVIGSTVDPKNGDTGPRAVSIAPISYGGLKAGQLLVCNFDDSTGAAGKGTTLVQLDPQPASKPATFKQSGDIEGCDGDAVTSGNSVYGTGMTSGLMAWFSNTGELKKTYGSPLEQPFANAYASCGRCFYAAPYIFTSDSKTGSIVDISLGAYGTNKLLQVATGFAVNGKTGWSALGPSGLAYDVHEKALYIVDGKNNTIVEFTHADELLVKDEIVVQPGGKTFKCKYPGKKSPCGKLIYSGKPLDAPVAATLLPNGNLVVANTEGGNTLVELTPAGKVLDTKVVDKSKTAGIFGLAAAGTKDSNTTIFFTDTNSNTVQELEK
jgi:hypothetical protein